MDKERLKELDIIRSIAFICVVIQHILGGYSNIKGLPYDEYLILKIFYVVAKPAVPIFLCISAISLFYVYYDKINIKDYYKKRILYIIIPYVIWSAINILSTSDHSKFNTFILQLLAGNGMYHLWYMGLIIRFYLYFPLILFITRKVNLVDNKYKVLLFLLLFILYFYVTKYQTSISTYVGKFIFNNPSKLQQRIVNISPIFWYLYIMIGIYIGLNYKKFINLILKYKMIILISYLSLLTYSFLDEIKKVNFIRIIYLLFTSFSILTIFILVSYLINNGIIYKFLLFVSRYSFAAYMLHIIVLQGTAEFINYILPVRDYLLTGVLTLIVTVIISPAIIKIISLLPYSEYITGCTKKSLKKNIQDIQAKI